MNNLSLYWAHSLHSCTKFVLQNTSKECLTKWKFGDEKLCIERGGWDKRLFYALQDLTQILKKFELDTTAIGFLCQNSFIYKENLDIVYQNSCLVVHSPLDRDWFLPTCQFLQWPINLGHQKYIYSNFAPSSVIQPLLLYIDGSPAVYRISLSCSTNLSK